MGSAAAAGALHATRVMGAEGQSRLRGTAHRALRALGLVASIATLFGQTGEQDQQVSSIACYSNAREATTLDEYQSWELCIGARTVEPVDCWVQGRERLFATGDELVGLCRCATSTAPVDCAQEWSWELEVEPLRVLQLCSAIVVMKLFPDCTPRAYY
jgi:hypothetical protein